MPKFRSVPLRAYVAVSILHSHFHATQLIQREEEERKRGATKSLPVSTPLLDDLRAKKLAKLRKARADSVGTNGPDGVGCCFVATHLLWLSDWNVQARERTLPRDKPRVIISKTGKKVRTGSASMAQV